MFDVRRTPSPESTVRGDHGSVGCRHTGGETSPITQGHPILGQVRKCFVPKRFYPVRALGQDRKKCIPSLLDRIGHRCTGGLGESSADAVCKPEEEGSSERPASRPLPAIPCAHHGVPRLEKQRGVQELHGYEISRVSENRRKPEILAPDGAAVRGVTDHRQKGCLCSSVGIVDADSRRRGLFSRTPSSSMSSEKSVVDRMARHELLSFRGERISLLRELRGLRLGEQRTDPLEVTDIRRSSLPPPRKRGIERGGTVPLRRWRYEQWYRRQVMQHHDQLEGRPQECRTAEISLLGEVCEVVGRRAPPEDRAYLVELLQPGGKYPLTRSIRLGLLRNGADGELHMMRAHAAGHNAMNIGRLPTALPGLIASHRSGTSRPVRERVLA